VISRARRHRYSYSEYLILEESSSVRHEFADGEIYAIAGGTPTHAALAAIIIRLVGAQLPVGCRAYSSDLRVRVPETGLSTYPDVTVVGGQTTRAADDPVAVTNPVLVVEVTSPSTEDYDRGEKLTHYQRLPKASRKCSSSPTNGRRFCSTGVGPTVTGAPSTRRPDRRSSSAL
jgi:Uma2 family endonuclease